MGERRLRAAQRAELAAIPAIVRQTADDAMLRDALLENIHRVQLNPLEEAAAYQQLLDEFDGDPRASWPSRIGRSRPVITNTIRLLQAPPRRCSAGSPPACCRPGTPARCSAWTTPARRRSSPPASWPRGCRCGPPRRRSRSLKSAAPPKPKAAPRKPMQAPGLQDVAERLSDTFDTRVKVELGRRKGQIVVEFGSVDDLERIVELMAKNGTNRTS